MKIIDAHCHLDSEVFDADRDAVIANALAVDVEHIVIPGVDIDNWEKIASLCEQDDSLSACYGLHPYFVDKHKPEHLLLLKQYVSSHSCVAIGECGLDYREDMADRNKQHEYFASQLRIAIDLDKPVVIHSVKATEQVIKVLKHYPGITGMIHSYSGSYEQAAQLVDMGFYLSFGGAITHDRAVKLRETAGMLPLTSLLIETDAPDQPDALHYGQRNEPAFISNVLATLAKLHNEDIDVLSSQLYNNTRNLFRLNI